MIMAEAPILQNRLRAARLARGWVQEELARRSGVSRAGVSAIETGRLVPSAAAALSLVAALGCRVEDVFSLSERRQTEPMWAWPPAREPCRYWHAEVAGRTLLYPAEAAQGRIGHDGVYRAGSLVHRGAGAPEETLVIACCDPAAGLLAAELERRGVRLLVLDRSSRQALALVRQRLVHAAGVHLSAAGEPAGNATWVHNELGPGYSLLRMANWQEGVALAPGLGIGSVRSALRSRLSWIGREAGSGARHCLDELLPKHRTPRRLAQNHRGVAEAVRCGWAEAGVCLQLVSEEAGLDFFSVREEAYDLCFPVEFVDDPRLKALVEAVRSAALRGLLDELPGYDCSAAGELQPAARAD